MTRPALAALAVLLLGCGQPQGTGPNKHVPSDMPAKTAPEPAPAPAPEPEGPPVRKDGTIYAETQQMGTRVSINVHVGERKPAEAGAAIEAAFAEIERIEQIMSEWRPSSELSQLNDGAGGPLRPLSAELFEVLQRSKEIAQATGGAFDPTFYGVGQLWKYDPGSRPPTREAILEKLPLVDWRAIELDATTRSGRLAKPGMKMGLGAIAKGYAVDRASTVLRERGFTDHIVEGGGDTFVSGTKGGKTWMVGIQRPDGPGSVAAIPARDRAVVTSGDYQRFIEFEGVRYSHILDPRTGFPVPEERSLQSITILAPNATEADAYATAVAVLGADAGLEFIQSHPGLDAALITHSGELRVTPELAKILVYPQAKPPAPSQPAPSQPAPSQPAPSQPAP
ncbi:FAD:protein FMN transferase [Nannocystis pusilla]|uniref:FAD:protein FMN transferase n=1 Tax=Nannocystis pusilla TaxID=889268 RepID=UPI003DA520A8